MTKPDRILYRVSVRVRGKWEARSTAKANRPTKGEAQQIGYNVDAMRSRDEPHIVDAVRIIRVEEFGEEVIEL